MADANIKVDWTELENKGKEMVVESENISTILNKIESEVSALGEKWQSNASTQMVEYIQKIKKNTIPRYTAVVKEYGDFLKEASDRYSRTEADITDKANELLDFQ